MDMEGDFEMVQGLLGRFQRAGTLPTIRTRLKRLAGIGIGVAVAALLIPFGGFSGPLLQLWAIVGLGLGGLSLPLWVSTKESPNGWFDPPDVDDGSEIDVDRELLITILDVLILASCPLWLKKPVADM